MIRKFAQFWLENTKVTIVLILITVFTGIGSYIFIPKQYNPDIPVPAYNIIVPAPGFSAKEVKNLVIQPLEDIIYEIEGIDDVYGISNKDAGVLTVSYEVGTDKEKATTRLYNKIFENMSEKPIGVQEPIIKKMDSDDFPIYTFAIVNKNQKDPVLLRKTGIEVADKLKFVDGTSVFYLVGGYKDNINIHLDLQKLKGKNINIMQVYQAIKKNNIVFPGGELKLENTSSSISINGNIDSIEKLNKIIVGNYNNKPIYLQEVASIFKGVGEKEHYSLFTNQKYNQEDAIFIGVAKSPGENQVSLANNIKEKLKNIEQNIPDGYEIIEIDNQGEVASSSTNGLLINLGQSVLIVFIVLLFYLGRKNAINNAFSIPLTLFMVFLIALIIGDNINRIVLFALVLALGMLVDNSTVVIENISRHLKEKKDGETAKEAILKAVDEVGVGVILATITRILALVAMFFVTGMMGEYMGGVPKYVIISLIVSLLIAFSINPFLAYFFHKEEKIENKKEDKKSKLVIIYEKFLDYFLGHKKKLRRILFKLVFGLSLVAVIVIPPALGVFKMAMLPKDNKNQIYIWIDGQKNWTVEKSKKVANYTNEVLKTYYDDKNSNNLKIIKDTSYWIGIAPVVDFSNAFRGVNFRNQSNQISLRANLIDKEKREISSIDFTMEIRDILKQKVLEKYPSAKIRVLEDPAGPPVRASFMLKVQGDRSIDYKNLEELANFTKEKLKPLFKKDDVVDVYTTIDTYKTNYDIDIDHQLLSKYGLSVEQVSSTIYNIFEGNNVSLVHDKHTKEPINIQLTVKDEEKYTQNIFEQISFINQNGQKVYLKEFANIVPTKQENTIYTENKYKTVYIYGEIGENSVWYPALHISLAMMKDSFYEGNFEVENFSPYGLGLKSKKTGEEYKINWGGERKLSINTFRDLGIAMIIALLSIYFLMVAQFKSFKIAGVIMMTFLVGMFGIMPGFSIVYKTLGVWFTAPSMIGAIALAGIVVGNAIILIEYLNLLLKNGYNKKIAIIKAGSTRMRAIIITSLTTVLGSMTILQDPVWGGLGWTIVWGLSVSAILTLIVIPIFLYDVIDYDDKQYKYKVDETINFNDGK